MRATGIVRCVDTQGRFCIPKEVIRSFRLAPGTKLDLYIKNNRIYMEKYDEDQEPQGIVRCIDSIGRVCYPKEARKNLGIFEGTEVEVLIDNGKVCFIKHQPLITDELRNIAERLSRSEPLKRYAQDALDLADKIDKLS